MGLHHDPAMDIYSIDSTLDKIIKIEKDLRKLASGLDLLEEKLPVKQNISTQTDYAHKFGSVKESSYASEYGDKNVMGNFNESFNSSMTKKVDAAVYCDILKPQYTRFGRQIKVKRFSEEVNIDAALEESDIPSWPHHADNLPTRPSKKRKVGVKKMRTVIVIKPDPDEITKVTAEARSENLQDSQNKTDSVQPPTDAPSIEPELPEVPVEPENNASSFSCQDLNESSKPTNEEQTVDFPNLANASLQEVEEILVDSHGETDSETANLSKVLELALPQTEKLDSLFRIQANDQAVEDAVPEQTDLSTGDYASFF